jgi:hypothetical protein
MILPFQGHLNSYKESSFEYCFEYHVVVMVLPIMVLPSHADLNNHSFPLIIV